MVNILPNQLNEVLYELVSNDKLHTYQYTAEYNAEEKRHLTYRCHELGLKVSIRGSGPSVTVVIYKKKEISALGCRIGKESLDALRLFSMRYSLNPLPTISEVKQENNLVHILGMNFDSCGYAQKSTRYDPTRETIATYSYRKAIVNLIKSNKVSIICGESGCGKTTQVPQYIMEECEEGTELTIVCIEPNHIATMLAANTVVDQRGERIGATVGYYIEKDSRFGPLNALTYCTADVFIQSLVSGTHCLANINYIIIDEIHLRNRLIDFILIVVKEFMQHFENLKVVLLTATSHVDIYRDYFKECGFMEIPSRSYPVIEYFVEDVIVFLKYHSQEMNDLIMTYDELLIKCMENGGCDDFAQLYNLVVSNKLDVNYQEQKYGFTPLIVAAVWGHTELVEELINLGAIITTKSQDGLTAHEYASYNCRFYAAGAIETEMMKNSEHASSDTSIEMDGLINLYNQAATDDKIDLNLVVEIIQHIQATSWDTLSILIFLPGYDYIIDCINFIKSHPVSSELKILTLCSETVLRPGSDVFQNFKERKVILTTDLAESSFRIKDVGYVIDTGRITPKLSDLAAASNSIVFEWISQLSSNQRKSRAGFQSNGQCFRLYSKKKYKTFNITNTSELVDLPIQDLCLRAKVITPYLTIEQFFDRAVEAPSTKDVKNAVHNLKMLGMIDKNENLTVMGYSVIKIFVEPQIAKMLLYGIFLKCLDPVLSLAAYFQYKNPILKMSVHGTNLVEIQETINKLSKHSQSDHMSLLVAQRMWEMYKNMQNEEKCVDLYNLSPGAMENIIMLRSSLLQQLRAAGYVYTGFRDNTRDLNKYSESFPMIKAALASSLYPNIAIPKDGILITRNNFIVIDPSSCLSVYPVTRLPLAYMYQDFTKYESFSAIKCVTAVTPITIALMCGSRAEYNSQTKTMRLDKKFLVHIQSDVIWNFRCLLDRLLMKCLHNLHLQFNSAEEELHGLLFVLLHFEDKINNLAQPEGTVRRSHSTNPKSYECDPAPLARQISAPLICERVNYENFVNRMKELQLNSDIHLNYPYIEENNVNINKEINTNTIAGVTGDYFAKLNNEEAWGVTLPPNDPYAEKLLAQNLRYEQWTPNTMPKMKFFIIRPLEMKNIMISMQQHIWKFTAQTEKKIFVNFNRGTVIILLFNLRGTYIFQAVAKLRGTNNGICNASCPIEWMGNTHVHYKEIPNFTATTPRTIEDGYELPYDIGNKIANLLLEPGRHGRQPIFGKK